MRLLVLTGGSRGLGRALAEAAIRDGFEVIEFSRGAPHDFSIRVDLSSPLEANRVIGTRLAAVDIARVDEFLVISNAATLEPIGPVARKSAEAIVGHLNTNLTSAVLFCARIVSHFQLAPCRKVLASISAGSASAGVFGWSLYCAAKLGMDAFIRSLALEQADEPYPFIPVTVDPGVVNTGMHIAASGASPADFPACERFAERMARGELAAPAAVASSIIRLLARPSLKPGYYDVRDVKS